MKSKGQGIHRAVIADDDRLKAMEIKRTLKRQGISDVVVVGNQELLWQKIYPKRLKIGC